MSETSIQAIFAARLRAARLSLGISQADLGVAMGLPNEVASTRINRYETGKHMPDIRAAEKLAAALGIPLPALLSEDDGLAFLIIGFARLSKKDQKLKVAEMQRALGAERADEVHAKLSQAAPPVSKQAKPRRV